MTNLRKMLLITGTLIIGMQPIVQAYDVVGLKTEVAQILDASQSLYAQPSKEAKKAAKYLDKIITTNDSWYVSSDEIIILARIINSNVTLDAKVAGILNIKAEKEAQKVQQLEQDAKNLEEFNKQKAKQHNKNTKKKVLDACIMTSLCAVYGIALTYMAYELLMRQVQLHDNDLLSKVQQMITSSKTPKRWF
jgi:hypothetical protein